MAQFNQNAAITGLSTYSVIVPSAGPYFMEGKLSLPTLVGGAGASACVATVNLNGSPIYTGLAGAEGFRAETVCAAGDTLSVVLSSAAAPDQILNAIKGVVAVGQGV